MFLGFPSIFVLFVGKDGALNMRLHMVALPASVTLSWPAKITEMLNKSGLDFLVLVLQSANSSNMNAFFSNFVLFKYYCLQGTC